MGNIVHLDVRNVKEIVVALWRNIVDPAEEPTWDLFYLAHSMREQAQDDEESELVLSHRLLRSVVLGLFTARVTRIIVILSSEALKRNDEVLF